MRKFKLDSKCPDCGRNNDGLGGFDDNPPEVGCPVLCGGCGTICVLIESLVMQKMSKAAFNHLPSDQIAFLLSARAAVRSR